MSGLRVWFRHLCIDFYPLYRFVVVCMVSIATLFWGERLKEGGVRRRGGKGKGKGIMENGKGENEKRTKGRDWQSITVYLSYVCVFKIFASIEWAWSGSVRLRNINEVDKKTIGYRNACLDTSRHCDSRNSIPSRWAPSIPLACSCVER